jgi:F-type H+-transporting ATPase subunit gamma
MSNSTADLSQKITSAEDIQSVVRTMKALAASSIGQYQDSLRALVDYYHAVELGLAALLRRGTPAGQTGEGKGADAAGAICAIVFGSDQGLVGQFNERVADFAIKTLAGLAGKPQIWAVGERVLSRLADTGLALAGSYRVPSSVQAITPLVAQILIDCEADRGNGAAARVYVFHHRLLSGALYEPISQRLLPLDAQWKQELAKASWPTRTLPEILGTGTTALGAFVREYLFISLFRACAESLASENTSRLAAMERANKNIDELLEQLQGSFHRLRQSGIDEELFDVRAGSGELSGSRTIRNEPAGLTIRPPSAKSLRKSGRQKPFVNP